MHSHGVLANQTVGPGRDHVGFLVRPWDRNHLDQLQGQRFAPVDQVLQAVVTYGHSSTLRYWMASAICEASMVALPSIEAMVAATLMAESRSRIVNARLRTA